MCWISLTNFNLKGTTPRTESQHMARTVRFQRANTFISYYGRLNIILDNLEQCWISQKHMQLTFGFKTFKMLYFYKAFCIVALLSCQLSTFSWKNKLSFITVCICMFYFRVILSYLLFNICNNPYFYLYILLFLLILWWILRHVLERFCEIYSHKIQNTNNTNICQMYKKIHCI